MHWKAVLGFSTVGIAVGGASVAGAPELLLRVLLIPFGILAAAWLARHVAVRPPLHGFLIGFLAGALTAVVQAVFVDALIANNAATAATFDRLPERVTPVQHVLSFAPVIGLFQGVALAVFTWTAGNVYRGPGSQGS